MQSKKDTRHRFQYRFWLDANKDDELLLGEELEQLKQGRRFQPTIRNALRLFLDLAAGRVGVLEELFPGIVAQLVQRESRANAEFAALIELQRTQAALLERLSKADAGVSPEMHISPKGDTNLSTTVDTGDLPSLFVEVGESADPSEARQNFAAGMGDLFGDDEDEWD